MATSSLLKRLFLLAAVPLALAGAGCNTYSYLNIDMKIDPSFPSLAESTVTACRVFVSGAATDSFPLSDDVCPPPSTSNRLEIGIVDYSTFADSGNVTFLLKLYNGTMQTDACLVGSGTTSLAISSGKIVAGTLTATVNGTGNGCTGT
jgi:hypothetical protein